MGGRKRSLPVTRSPLDPAADEAKNKRKRHSVLLVSNNSNGNAAGTTKKPPLLGGFQLPTGLTVQVMPKLTAAAVPQPAVSPSSPTANDMKYLAVMSALRSPALTTKRFSCKKCPQFGSVQEYKLFTHHFNETHKGGNMEPLGHLLHNDVYHR